MADVYVDWEPSKRWGQTDAPSSHRPHPTPVCESRNLASVSVPVEGDYQLRLGHEEHLSTMQEETVRIALAALRAHGVFAMGDGTGIGKGRCIASMIAEWRAEFPGARVLWVSANQTLRAAAKEELALYHLGSDDGVEEPLDDDDDEAASLPSTSRRWWSSRQWFAFASYSGLSRLRTVFGLVELRRWLSASAGLGRPPLVVLDECHMLRHKQGSYRAVVDLLASVSSAAVVYSSATMMSDVQHLCYLAVRLPLCGADGDGRPQRASSSVPPPFSTTARMREVLKAGGASMMELVAIYLRSRGLYLCRQLSWRDVCVEATTCAVTAGDRRLYDTVARALWSAPAARGMLAQRTLLRLVSAIKVRSAIALAEIHLRRGRCVIFCLTRTAEASTQRALDAGETAPRHCLHDLVDVLDARGEVDASAAVSGLDGVAPLDAIDQIVAHFGAGRVAEITGRRVRYEPADASRAAWRVGHLASHADEVAAFQSGRKRVAVLTRAGGLGLSLHDVGSGPRTNILVDLPWSAEDVLQMLGRCHRSASVSAPSYVLCTLDVPAEVRVASTLTRRLAALGALTRAERRGADALDLRRAAALARPVDRVGTRRAVVLSLLARLLAERSPDDSARAVAAVAGMDASERALRRSDLALAGGTASLRASVALRDTCQSLLRILFSDATADDPLHGAMEHLLHLFPEHVARAVLAEHGGWTPSTHALYAPSDREAARTVFACHERCHARGCHPLGLLPHSLVEVVVAHAMDDREDARRVLHSGADAAALCRALLGTREQFLNAIVSLPVGAQESLVRMAARAAVAASEPGRDDDDDADHPVRPLDDVVAESGGRGVVATATVLDGPTDEGTYVVTVDVAARDCAEPGPTAVFFRSQHTRDVLWCDAESDDDDGAARVATSVDGTRVELCGDESLVRCAREDWTSRRERHVRRCAARCARVRRSYRLETCRALHEWESSTKKIVRVSVGTRRVVGLLMDAPL